MKMRDPFENDPFFSGGSSFGNMDEMMNRMQANMHHKMSSIESQMGSGGRFIKQTSKTTSKTGPDGRPIQETYNTHAMGGVGRDGKRVIDRKQTYEHSGTGLSKVAHERMLNDKGRKVVNERMGGNQNSYDHYKNMREGDASSFD
jgi:hypothetical protein